MAEAFSLSQVNTYLRQLYADDDPVRQEMEELARHNHFRCRTYCRAASPQLACISWSAAHLYRIGLRLLGAPFCPCSWP